MVADDDANEGGDGPTTSAPPPSATGSSVRLYPPRAGYRETRGGYVLEKGVAGSRIDLAVAAVLAYEARCDSIAAGDSDRSSYAFL